MSGTKGTRLFAPPTAGDCVEVAAELGQVREWILASSDSSEALEKATRVGLAIELLTAIASNWTPGVRDA